MRPLCRGQKLPLASFWKVTRKPMSTREAAGDATGAAAGPESDPGEIMGGAATTGGG
jgi:hypothetical protein